VCICSTIGKYARVFLLQVSSDQKIKAAQCSNFTCLWISLSSFSETFDNAPRYLTSPEKCACAPFRKTFDGAGFVCFLGQKDIIFFSIISKFVFSSIVITNIQKTLKSSNARAKHAYIISKLDDFLSYFPQCNSLPPS